MEANRPRLLSLQSESVVASLMLGWLIVDLVFERTFGLTGEGRDIAILRAIAQLVFLVVLLVLAAGKSALTLKTASSLAGGAFFALSIFVIGIFMALATSVIRGPESWAYVIGDTYKFLSLPLFVIPVIMVLRDPRLTEKIALGSAYIYGLSNAKNLVLYFTILGLNDRPVSIYLLPFMIIIWHSLYPKYKNLTGYRLLGVTLIGGFPFIAWSSQSLGLLGEALFFWLVYRMVWRRTYKTALLILFTVLCIIGLSISLISGSDGGSPNLGEIYGTHQTGMYIFNKLGLLGGVDPLGAILVLGGNRLLFPITVFQSYLENPSLALFGQGMGWPIELVQMPILDRATPEVWENARHFIENSYSEILYRAGFVGLLAYLSFLMIVLRRGFRGIGKQKSEENSRLLAACVAYIIYILVFSAFNVGMWVDGIESVYFLGFATLVTFTLSRNEQVLT